MKRYFEYADPETDDVSKFWEIEVLGSEIRLRYGPIGKKGQLTLKSYDSSDEAELASAKLIREKTNKGYVEPDAVDVKTCPSCSTERIPSASFCVNCGERLEDQEHSPAPEPTPFVDRCSILTELFLNYRDEPEWNEFFDYNDLGLPLAYAVDSGFIEIINEPIETLINHSFDLLLEAVGLDDTGFAAVEEILDRKPKDWQGWERPE